MDKIDMNIGSITGDSIMLDNIGYPTKFVFIDFEKVKSSEKNSSSTRKVLKNLLIGKDGLLTNKILQVSDCKYLLNELSKDKLLSNKEFQLWLKKNKSSSSESSENMDSSIPSKTKLVTDKKNNDELLGSIMHTWRRNKGEIVKKELSQDINEIIWKSVADHGFGDEDINMKSYDKLVKYLKKDY